jgi:FMN-dependent NADH-azoreductase
MSIVLFVKANDREIEQAVSVKLYHAFLESYKISHPDDKIIELDLFKEDLPYLNADMINGNFKAARGMDLTIAERSAVEVSGKYMDQFLAADKVVFGFPLWNLTIPAVLHTFLDYLNQAGKTFKYTSEGPIGLVPEKKVGLLTSRGGIYSDGPASAAEMSFNYIRNIMMFFGITDIVSVIVEGHNQFPEQAAALVAEGIANAERAAAGF